MRNFRSPSAILAPLATVFAQNGSVGSGRFGEDLELDVESELDAVVLLGSNGELATLDLTERTGLIEIRRKTVCLDRDVDRGPLLALTGNEVADSEHSRETAGIVRVR